MEQHSGELIVRAFIVHNWRNIWRLMSIGPFETSIVFAREQSSGVRNAVLAYARCHKIELYSHFLGYQAGTSVERD